MLDLEASVHLEEVEVLVHVEQELHGPRAHVVHGARGRDRDLAHLLADLLGEHRAGGLLDDLLVAPLDRALALEQVHDVAVRVGEDLDLDVLRVEDVLLDVDLAVAERGLGLAASALERGHEVLGGVDATHPLAAAAGPRLHEHGEPGPLGELERDQRVLDRGLAPRDQRNARVAHDLARLRLQAHRVDRLGAGPDEDDPGLGALAREAGVLGEEAVARVDRLSASGPRDLQDLLPHQVTLRAGSRPHEVRLVCQADMERLAVGLRVHRHALDPETA